MAANKTTSGLKFHNKVAIVTGGCSGIGKACAEILVEHGGHVVVFDIQDEAGKELQFEGPGQVTYMHCDMFDEDQIKTCVEKTVERLGRLDAVVNNVGMRPGDASIDEQTVADFRRVMDLNVVSHFATYKYALPHLRKTQGSVVNIGSFSGTVGQGKCPTYCATKGAIPAMARALAIDEAKHGVRINTVTPGVIDTPILSRILKTKVPEVAEERKHWSQLGRFGDPREVALACLFFITEATFSTGTELMCTGGCEIGYGVKA